MRCKGSLPLSSGSVANGCVAQVGVQPQLVSTVDCAWAALQTSPAFPEPWAQQRANDGRSGLALAHLRVSRGLQIQRRRVPFKLVWLILGRSAGGFEPDFLGVEHTSSVDAGGSCAFGAKELVCILCAKTCAFCARSLLLTRRLSPNQHVWHVSAAISFVAVIA